MTTLQIVQFLAVLSHTFLQFATEDCGFPPEQTAAEAALVASFLLLFLHFFATEYGVVDHLVGRKKKEE